KKFCPHSPQPPAHPSPPLPPLPVRTDRVADPWVEAPHAADHRRPAGPRRERAGEATAPGDPPDWLPPCRDRPTRPTGLCLRRTRRAWNAPGEPITRPEPACPNRPHLPLPLGGKAGEPATRGFRNLERTTTKPNTSD